MRSGIVRTLRSAQALRTIDTALRKGGLKAALQRASLRPQPAGNDLERVEQQVRLLRRLARILPGNTSCLRQSLSAQTLLADEGIDTTVLVGIRRAAPGEYEMHAWLTLNGEPVIDRRTDLEGFRITHTLSTSRPIASP